LTGSLAIEGNGYTLTAEIVDLTNDDTITQRGWQFSSAELPAALIGISEWVYHSLGVELTPAERAYLEDKKSLRLQGIDDFILHYTELQEDNSPTKTDLINALQKQHPDFVLFGIYALHNRIYATSLDDAYKNLELYKTLRSQYPGNVGIELESYRAMEIESLPKHIVAARIKNLETLMNKNPQDPTIMINFADALVKNGISLDGIATMLEAVERWSGQFRAWWTWAGH
jgi:hypothetical protein